MKFLRKKREVAINCLEGRKNPEPKFAPTIELKGNSTNDSKESTKEYEVVERVIYPEKIICPDCGGLTLEGLDFCDKCGGEIQDVGER